MFPTSDDAGSWVNVLTRGNVQSYPLWVIVSLGRRRLYLLPALQGGVQGVDAVLADGEQHGLHKHAAVQDAALGGTGDRGLALEPTKSWGKTLRLGSNSGSKSDDITSQP